MRTQASERGHPWRINELRGERAEPWMSSLWRQGRGRLHLKFPKWCDFELRQRGSINPGASRLDLQFEDIVVVSTPLPYHTLHFAERVITLEQLTVLDVLSTKLLELPQEYDRSHTRPRLDADPVDNL